MNRAERRRLQRGRSGGAKLPPAGAWTTFENTPVYDGTVLQVIAPEFPEEPNVEDLLLLLGIGPAGEAPVAYVLLCPRDDVPRLVDDLQEVAVAAEQLRRPQNRRGGRRRSS